jgi:hypothetical protein
MSPVFGVGINYAVQDAVAAARVLIPALLPVLRRVVARVVEHGFTPERL